MLLPGQVVDRYVVEGRLGEGATAVVYRVRHQVLGSVHALKAVGQAALSPRVVREGRIQAALRHPNLVAVTDVVPLGEGLGLVLELVEGPTLKQLLRERGRLGPVEAEALFRGILAGVEHAHAAGLVHRDLKPANILLARDDAGWVPKVADFGLARDGAVATRSGEGMAIGTPLYMAPEQVRGDATIGPRADLFALGSVLYEMLVGLPAFGPGDGYAVMRAVAAGRRPDVRVVAPGVPAHLAAVVDACLVVDEAARVPDCAAIRALLGVRPARSPVAALVGLGIAAVTGVGLLVLALPALAPSPPPPVVSPDPAAVPAAVPGAAAMAVAEPPVLAPPGPVAAQVPVPRPARVTPRAELGSVALLDTPGVSDVVLVSEEGARRPVGEVPAGRWLVRARFGGGESVEAGEVTVTPGERVRLRCSAEFLACGRE